MTSDRRGRGTMSIPQYDEYVQGAPLLTMLNNIQQFQVSATFPPMISVSQDARDRISTAIYDSTRDLLRATDLHYLHQLRVENSDDRVGVIYADDLYDFRVMFRFDDGRLIITKDGADLEVFHEWFKTFAPSASTIFDAVTSALTTIIFGPDNTQRSISPTQSGFTFWFIVHDFRKRLRDGDLSKDSYRNSELLLRLVRGYPDQSGVVRNDPSLLADVGRMDVSMARAFDFGTGPRLCWFHVEAPANMDYAGLWLRFEYNAHSVKSGALVPRTDLDAGRVFLEGYHAYVLFLRDVVVNGFIDWLTQGYGFRAETSASGLTLRRP